MAKPRLSTEHLQPVVCRNPDRPAELIHTTKKVFESIYVDKGFELVTRDNADNGVNRSTQKPRGNKTPPASVQTGSAKDIAARLGIGSDADAGDPPASTDGGKAPRVQGEPRRDLTPANNAGSDVVDDEQGSDAIDSNSDGTVSDEREPNRRDRGRG